MSVRLYTYYRAWMQLRIRAIVAQRNSRAIPRRQRSEVPRHSSGCIWIFLVVSTIGNMKVLALRGHNVVSVFGPCKGLAEDAEPRGHPPRGAHVVIQKVQPPRRVLAFSSSTEVLRSCPCLPPRQATDLPSNALPWLAALTPSTPRRRCRQGTTLTGSPSDVSDISFSWSRLKGTFS